MLRQHIKLDVAPAEALARWPGDVPLAALWSGDGSQQGRWTILARASRTVMPGTLGALSRLIDSHRVKPPRRRRPDTPPFTGGWIGAASYALGEQIEPKAREFAPQREGGRWPLMAWQRCDDAYIFDHHLGRWWQVGDNLPALDVAAPAARDPGFSLGALRSGTGPRAYRAAVRRALEYIEAGDVFQVNLAHRLRTRFSGSPRALAAALFDRARPRYGAYLEWPGHAIVSASPELFLEVTPPRDGRGGTIRTQPMKGTRPGSARPSELRDSVKDRAELDMIVDLMRNDLGRVARLGTVRVDADRTIERHGGGASAGRVWQATATVSAELRPDAGLADLLRATFPPGSVTGAPKIRAMQIINELEPHARGPYCGAIGYVSDCGHAAFNVAIRTALVRRGTLDWFVGAGIVADSDPAAEWRETLDKARTILSLAGRARRSRR